MNVKCKEKKMGEKVNTKKVRRRICKKCRLCGNSGVNYKDIFKASIKLLEGNSVNNVINYSYKPISIVIQECLNFNVTKENEVSNVICIKCIKELTSWSKFQNHCLQQQLSSDVKCNNLQNDHSVENNDTKNITSSPVFNLNDSNESTTSTGQSGIDKCLDPNATDKKQKKKAFEKCSNCKSIFKDLNEQSVHQLTDKGCIFTCLQCSKKFRSKDTLRNHLEIHSNTNNFCCHICGLLFSTRSRLYHHFNTHEPDKQYQCTYCSKQFSVAYDLEKHIRIHTGERPFKCQECNAHFAQYSVMTRHVEAVHKKTKKFTCSICSKSFLYKNHFTAHLMLHSGQKDIVCEICNKGFVTKNALCRHQRNHTGEKPYPCPECGKRFADCSNRKRHVLQHHGSDKPERTKKKGQKQCKKKEKEKMDKPQHTLKTFLEDPELILGNLSDKRDESLSEIEDLSKNNEQSDIFNDCDVFNEVENPHNSNQNENNTLTLTVLDEDDNRSLEFLSQHLLQYENTSPRIEEDNFLQIKNKLISNGIEPLENYTNKLEELQQLLNETDVDKVRLGSSIQCHSLTSVDVLNLELALGTEQVDIQQRWAADILNNIAPCETQSILKMLSNQGTILLTFPDNEDFPS